MNFKHFTSAVALAAAIVAAPAHAAVLFQDPFDADYDGSRLNVGSLANWTIASGSVDYLKGFPDINCIGGGCLDMDGTTFVAGRIRSNATYGFTAGMTYTLEAQVSGSQRSGVDAVTLGFINTTTMVETFQTFSGIQSTDPFAPRSISFAPLSNGNFWLFIQGVGGDNIGVIVDNVVLSDRTAAVPEPATLMLSGLALLAAGVTRRRRG